MTTGWVGMFALKYATETPKTGASNKLYITCQYTGRLFKFNHDMSMGSFSWHILPTYILVRRSVRQRALRPPDITIRGRMDPSCAFNTIQGRDVPTATAADFDISARSQGVPLVTPGQNTAQVGHQ